MTGSIDKQEAIKLVADYLYNLMSPRCIGLTPDHCWKEAEDILAKAPSAEIACKDCRHYIWHEKRCAYWNHGATPSEWCCHAEKEMVMEKLKPCPFCGMPYTELYWVTTEKRGFDTLGIFCNNCKQTVTLEENEWEGDTSDTKRKAIKAWNRRAGEQDG